LSPCFDTIEAVSPKVRLEFLGVSLWVEEVLQLITSAQFWHAQHYAVSLREGWRWHLYPSEVIAGCHLYAESEREGWAHLWAKISIILFHLCWISKVEKCKCKFKDNS
jgi:hypothetical protein